MPWRPAQTVAAVRRFNRFYTRQIGVLRKNLSRQPLLARRNARALRDRARRRGYRDATSRRALDLDAGYLSRLLRNFEKRGLISRKTSDRRRAAKPSRLDARAAASVFAPLEKRSQQQAGGMLGKLNDRRAGADSSRAMSAIETLLNGDCSRAEQADLATRATARRFRLDRHPSRRALRAGIWLGRAVRGPVRADRRRLRQQIRLRSASDAGSPRLNGENVGCVMLVKDEQTSVARIRLLLVDPKGARARSRRPAGRRMRALCARGRLQEDHAVDAQRAHRRAPHLREGRLHAHLERKATQLGQGRGRRNSGIWTLYACAQRTRPSRLSPSAGADARRAAAGSRRNCTAGSGSRAGAPGSRPRRPCRRRASPAGRKCRWRWRRRRWRGSGSPRCRSFCSLTSRNMRRKAVHPLLEQRLDRLRRHVAAGEAGAAGRDDDVDQLVGDPRLHLLRGSP